MLPAAILDSIRQLANTDTNTRRRAAADLASKGGALVSHWLETAQSDSELAPLIVQDSLAEARKRSDSAARLTTGVAVQPGLFEEIRAANGSPSLAEVPPDLDALEFELHFDRGDGPPIRLDILTTKAPGGTGAIARFLDKFGEGIQQVEVDVTDVDRATEIVRRHFEIQPIYPATRGGANCTRINFFLVPASNGKKLLLELVEASKP